MGKRLGELTASRGLKLVRGGTELGFWDNPAIAAGDTIVEVIHAD